jgi:hypothetical protein
MSTPEPRRSPGRPPRTGPPAPPAEPAETPTRRKTARAEIAELAEQCAAIAAPPEHVLAGAQITFLRSTIDDGNGGQPNAALKEVLCWFEAISEVGTPEDLRLAWESWRPNAVGLANPKLWALARFDALLHKAGARSIEINRRAEIERGFEIAAEDLRRDLALALSEVERAMAELQRAEAEVERIERARADLERRQREHMQ